MEGIIKIPTSLRFKNKKTAKSWLTDTKTWHPIREMHNQGDGYFEIATNSFSWVCCSLKTIDKEFEFKYNEKHSESVMNNEDEDEEEDDDSDEMII